MPASRRRIIAYLVRRPATIPQLAQVTRLAPMTVRHHLVRLQADGFVAVTGEERRQAVGRSATLYALTELGAELFPRRYDQLARLALDELADLDPGELASLRPEDRSNFTMRRLAQRAAAPHRERLEGLEGQARAEAALAILEDECGFVELGQWEGRTELAACNCPYARALSEVDDDVCRFHASYVGELMGAAVELVARLPDGAEACRFRVAPAS